MHFGALLCAALLASTGAFAQVADVPAQPAAPVISLVGETPNTANATTPVKGEASFANAPANFHRFASARLGEDAHPEQLTLRFAASTTLTGIKSSKDFTIEQGSTCSVGAFYSAGSTCALMVRFTPQGPGHRSGQLMITNTASAQPAAIGLGGNGFAPVVSFTPALITTVPGTFISGNGLLNGAQNLTVDGGDIVYIADTGNNTIRELDSSGNLVTPLTSPIATPASVAVDNFGIMYTANTHGSTYYFSIYYPWGTQTAYGYAYVSSNCTPSAPCAFSAVGMNFPANIGIDTNNNLFMEEGTSGALEMPVSGISGGSGTLNLWHLSDQFAYSSGSPGTFAVDALDNLYTFYNFSTTTCYIIQEPLFNAEHNPTAIRVAGGTRCGFSGDGGPAGKAEIGSKVGQIAFDIAGNLYFTDSANARVRRIDSTTGIINTIAGNGTCCAAGDGGPATSASLKNPTGVGVDSQGQVYVINGFSGTTTQAIRKLGPNGFVTFSGTQAVNTTSAASLVTVANTGNAELTLTNAVFTGTNPGDFAIDQKTTSCNLTAGGTLFSGESCTVGILFKPSAAGARTANLVLLDNTVTNSNTVQLAGTGVAGPVAMPAVNLSSSVNPAKNCKSLVFSITVDGASGSTPTGTVVLEAGSTVLATANLNQGKAEVSAAALKKGKNVLSASYQGNAIYSAATSPALTQMVSQACRQSKKQKARS